MTEAQIAKLFDSSNVDLPRKTVITTYNTKSYQVDGLDFTKNPDTYKFVLTNGPKKGQTMTMYQYILEFHRI